MPISTIPFFDHSNMHVQFWIVHLIYESLDHGRINVILKILNNVVHLTNLIVGITITIFYHEIIHLFVKWKKDGEKWKNCTFLCFFYDTIFTIFTKEICN